MIIVILLLSGLPSNEIPGFVPYVATIGGLAALLLILCIFFAVFTWLRTKNKPVAREEFAEGPSVIKPKVEDTVYEEIDELQQNPQTIYISKNMAYCQFHGMQTPKEHGKE